MLELRIDTTKNTIETYRDGELYSKIQCDPTDKLTVKLKSCENNEWQIIAKANHDE